MYTVYSKPNCTFCDQAKALLNSLGISYEERIVDVGQPQEEGKTYVTVQQLKEVVPSAKTVPQILREDGSLVGGFTELKSEVTRTFDVVSYFLDNASGASGTEQK